MKNKYWTVEIDGYELAYFLWEEDAVEYGILIAHTYPDEEVTVSYGKEI